MIISQLYPLIISVLPSTPGPWDLSLPAKSMPQMPHPSGSNKLSYPPDTTALCHKSIVIKEFGLNKCTVVHAIVLLAEK